MRFILALLLSMSSVVARAESPSFLISHEKFVKLSAADKQRYVAELRTVLFQFDTYAGEYFVQLKRQHPWMTLLMGEALALEGTKENSKREPRCIYGGFIIEGAKCQAHKPITLVYPLEVNMDGQKEQVNEKITLACPGGQVLCNPLVFGVKDTTTESDRTIKSNYNEAMSKIREKIKPYCVSAPSDRRNTTRECFFISRDDEKKRSAETLIQYNPGEWQDFRSLFSDMCNPAKVQENKYLKGRARAQRDVLDTCEWARWRMDKLDVDGVARVAGREPRLPDSRKNSYAPSRDLRTNDSKSNEPAQ